MGALPKSWRIYEGRDPDEEARRLRSRFQTISRRYEWALRWRRLAPWLRISAVAGVGAFVITCALLSLSPWPPLAMLRHLAAFPNCMAARAVGLAPSYRGQPGYWASHDEDGNGRSCEPWP